MVVNKGKTNVLCVSDSLSYTPSAYILDKEGGRIEDTKGEVSVLGFKFGPRPSPVYQVLKIRAAFRKRFWTLSNLRNRRFSEQELLEVYKTFIRPLEDYCDVAYHSLLTDKQDEMLENLQNHALRLIYGPGKSARQLRAATGLPTLRERRIDHCDKFAAKCAGSERFAAWFPMKGGRKTRCSDQYLEEPARCHRLYNSPIFYMRRRLNGKIGKEYGLRYKEYRE